MLRATVWVAVGAVGTFVSALLAAVLLPVVGLGVASVVGPGLPTWVFAVPLLACPVFGGAATGFLQRSDWRAETVLGALAAALGSAGVGLLAGLGLLVVALGMAPNHVADPVRFSAVAPGMAATGAGVGFLVGALLGGFGAAGGHVVRRELR